MQNDIIGQVREHRFPRNLRTNHFLDLCRHGQYVFFQSIVDAIVQLLVSFQIILHYLTDQVLKSDYDHTGNNIVPVIIDAHI